MTAGDIQYIAVIEEVIDNAHMTARNVHGRKRYSQYYCDHDYSCNKIEIQFTTN